VERTRLLGLREPVVGDPPVRARATAQSRGAPWAPRHVIAHRSYGGRARRADKTAGYVRPSVKEARSRSPTITAVVCAGSLNDLVRSVITELIVLIAPWQCLRRAASAACDR
jgi:hypothetical protein